MNTKDFIEIISKPVQLTNEQLFDLEEIIQKFPFFQTARVLHLKGLKNQKSIQYNEALRTTAAYTSDRSILFHYITSDDFFDGNRKGEESKIIDEIELVDEKVIENLNQDISADKLTTQEESPTSEEEKREDTTLSGNIKDLDKLAIEPEFNVLVTTPLLNEKSSAFNHKEEVIEIETFENIIESEASENNLTDKKENIISDEEIQSGNKSNQESENTFELDIENEIVQGINDEQIEIYIDSYSGDLDKEELRNLLEQYKTKSEDEALVHDKIDYKKELFFEIDTDDKEEIADETHSEEKETPIIEKSDSIIINSELINQEVAIETPSSTYGFIFEIDNKEVIQTLSDSEEQDKDKKDEIETTFDLRFEPIQEKTNFNNAQESLLEASKLTDKEEESQVIEFKKEDTHLFNEWLQLSSFKPINRSENPIEEINKDKKKELIDNFIDNNPKITPIKSTSTSTTIDLYTEDTADEQLVMTETLAQIYTEQKKYNNAIKAYEVLSLKFPEKSGFFADQIKTLKILKQE